MDPRVKPAGDRKHSSSRVHRRCRGIARRKTRFCPWMTG